MPVDAWYCMAPPCLLLSLYSFKDVEDIVATDAPHWRHAGQGFQDRTMLVRTRG